MKADLEVHFYNGENSIILRDTDAWLEFRGMYVSLFVPDLETGMVTINTYPMNIIARVIEVRSLKPVPDPAAAVYPDPEAEVPDGGQ